MKTKLTLTVDKEVIVKAKEVATQSGTSVSELVENFLRQLTRKEKKVQEKEVSALVMSLKGSVKVPEDFDYDALLSEQLTKKYRK